MFRRKHRSRNSFLVRHSSSRGSDILKPDNTSLIVNRSETETDELPGQLTSLFSEDEEGIQDTARKSSSLMKSLSQKKQSTPLTRSYLQSRNSEGKTDSKSQNFTRIRSKSPFLSTTDNVTSHIEGAKTAYFEEVLRAGGASSAPGNSSYLMFEDQAVFSIKVNNKLKGSPEKIRYFLNSIEEKIKENDDLQKMLTHTLTSDSCEVARGPIQDPLLRILLCVECLQADLIDLLLNKIASILLEKKVHNEHVQIVSSILRQMRFLNKASNIKIASKLFEIIYVASVNVKREIIFILPEIISEEETEKTCTQLMDLLKFDVALTNVIIDAVTNLPLKKAVQSQVCTKMVNRLDKCPLEFLPALLHFILNKCNSEDLIMVINGIRENLPFSPHHFHMKKMKCPSDSQKSKEEFDEDSYIKLTFENLKFSIMASKEISEAWIKIISDINSSTEFRCLDFIMLIIFYDCFFGRKSQVLQVIKNKIKLTVLTKVQIENVFQMLLVIMAEYFSTVLELSSILLKSIENSISNFGAYFYKESFINFNFYMEESVMSQILLHIATGSPGTINNALGILKDLSENEKEALSHHTTSIMGLLIKVPNLSLTQVRLLMDVIASLVFFKPVVNDFGYQDELQIFIRKQLISSKQEECKKGIVAAIMAAKYAMKDTECYAVQINSLLDAAMGSSGNSESKRGFFNDEFAAMLRDSSLSELFLQTWSNKIFTMVMEHLFESNSDQEYEDFQVSPQYILHADNVQKIFFPALNFITEGTAKKPLFRKMTLAVIPSVLRLLWCLDGNSNRILPSFYASVIMPNPDVYDNFDKCDNYQKKHIMDCLFICANYLIESINGLCTREIFDKALLRVNQLIEVRKLIARHIHLVPEYVPPLCQFHLPVQKTVPKKKNIQKMQKIGRKRKLEEAAPETLNDSSLECRHLSGTLTPCDEFVGSADIFRQETDLYMYSGYFRELDFLTHKLLGLDLKLEISETSCLMAEKENRSFSNRQKPELLGSVVLFFLKDFIFKFEQVLKLSEPTFKSEPVISPTHNLKPKSFVKAATEILPAVIKKMEFFSGYCENLLRSSDWIYDSPRLYSQEACYIKLALDAALKLLAEIIMWRGFQNSENKPLLEEILVILSNKGMRGKYNTNTTFSSKTASEIANYLASFSKTVLIFSGGLHIIKLVQFCVTYSSVEQDRILRDLCHEFLCRKWLSASGAVERGLIYNQNVEFLLKTYFSVVDDKLDIIQGTAKIALCEVEGLTGKDSALKTFRAVNKSNFPLLYRSMCEALISASTKEFSRVDGDNQNLLNKWNLIIETLLVLVEIAKICPSRVILASLLKRSQSIIQLFLSKGMPVVESALRVKSVEVLTLLKSLQFVTRFLHSICCHSRVTNDSVVAAHVPIIRSQCERLTLEVKGMMILNEIPMDCITIAILKNRDLKGNDIISQETFENDSDDDSELPPEDTPDSERKSNFNESGETQESSSEVY